MHIEHVSLRGRRGGMILANTLAKFGGVIPWLKGTDDLLHATNGAYVDDELHRRIGVRKIVPFLLVTDDRARSLLGSMLTFSETPEQLIDPRNLALVQSLEAGGARYISCLQIRHTHRGDGNGTALMLRAIRTILRDYGAVWGVVDNPDLLRWYRELGAETPSPVNNHDNLWIVTWRR